MVVEVELRRALFASFRDFLKGDSGLFTMCRRDAEAKQISGAASYFLSRTTTLTLGEMRDALSPGIKPRTHVMSEFERWRRKNFPHLIDSQRAFSFASKLDQVNRIRNEKSHSFNPEAVTNCFELCRDCIQLIFNT